MPEMHLGRLGFTYSTFRSFTKNKEKNQQKIQDILIKTNYTKLALSSNIKGYLVQFLSTSSTKLKNPPWKKFIIMKHSCLSKKSRKCFYTFDKTPLGETGCLSNLYYLLAARVSSVHLQNCCLKKMHFRKSFSLKTLTS